MARVYDPFGLHGKAKNDNADLVANLQRIVDTSKDRTTLLTNLVILIQKRDAVAWNAGFKIGKEKNK